MSDPLVPVATGLTIWNMLCGDGPVSRGLGKLVETIADQFGQGLQSTNDWLRAKSRASVQLTEARAQIAADQLTLQGEHDSKLLKMRLAEESAATWHQIQQKRRERNIEKVLSQTAEELRDTPEAEVSDQKVDPDWTTQFFNYAQDVSDEGMQRVWSKLLAGEVKEPGSFSPRTLHVVKSLVRKEGEMFVKICSVIWKQLPGTGLIALLGQQWLQDNSVPLGFTYSDCMRMEECGLLNMEALGTQINFRVGRAFFQYFDRGFLFEKSGEQAPPITLPAGQFQLTTSGRELARIAAVVPNAAYLEAILDNFRKLGWTIRSATAEVIDSNTIRYNIHEL